MNQFVTVAQAIVKDADRFIEKNGVTDFSQEATMLLEIAQMHKLYNYQELVQNVFERSFDELEQNFKFLEFSDLPLTIARGEHTFIDLYFWRRRPTVIHNHHFSGAFQCLEGSNVDLEFEFTQKREIGRFHGIGDIKISKSHVVKSGDIQEVAPFDRFIHQNHHQSDLTVNLCFRSLDIDNKNLSNYFFSGLRYEKNPTLIHRTERLIRMANLGSFDIKELDLSIDDALYFLIETEGTASQNLNLLAIRSYFQEKVLKETGLNITRMFEDHERELDKIQDQYE